MPCQTLTARRDRWSSCAWVGATLIEVLDAYADDLADVSGRLYLSGLDEKVSAQLRHAGKPDLDGVVQLVPASDILGASTEQALESANAWLGHKREDSPPAKPG
jgi:sulfate permease, SulP family